jgi:hypothetical protein
MNVVVPKLGAVLMMAISLMLAGCGNAAAPLPRIAVKSPVDTALSWFKAVNENNMPLALAHFAPADRSQMEWSDVGSFSFDDLRCHVMVQATRTSQVECAFKVHNPPIDLLDDTFWDISMQRKPFGPWLITGYGTG